MFSLCIAAIGEPWRPVELDQGTEDPRYKSSVSIREVVYSLFRP